MRPSLARAGAGALQSGGSSGKLILPIPAARWLPGILSHHGIDVIELNLDICARAAELPPIHRDPCDRFIIATAILYGMPVVTADERFARYGVKAAL
jgi:PIN domain nuclease of toxin-antitoxin system